MVGYSAHTKMSFKVYQPSINKTNHALRCHPTSINSLSRGVLPVYPVQVLTVYLHAQAIDSTQDELLMDLLGNARGRAVIRDPLPPGMSKAGVVAESQKHAIQVLLIKSPP